MKFLFKNIKKELSILTIGLLAFTGYSSVIYNIGYSNGKDMYKTPNIIYIDDNADVSTIPTFLTKNAKDGLKEALTYYNIKYKDIVYAQAVLETANFSSPICLNNKNLFGLYSGRKKEFMKFSHWAESVIAYKVYIESRYKKGDYYDFLQSIGYAEDDRYIQKIKEIVSQHRLSVKSNKKNSNGETEIKHR